MDRSTVWTGEVPRTYDILKGMTRIELAQCFMFSDVVGGAISLSAGQWFSNGLGIGVLSNDFGGQTAFMKTNSAAGFNSAFFVGGFHFQLPASMQFNCDAGTIYIAPSGGIDTVSAVPGGSLTPAVSLLGAPLGATNFGDLATPNTTTAPIQCIVQPTNLTGFVAPGAGLFNAYIIEAVPYQQDQTDTDDPNYSTSGGSITNSGILPFYNSASPTTPLAGPGGTTPPTSSQTDRRAFGTLQVCTTPALNQATAAAAAAAVTADAHTIPLFLVITQHGDTQLTNNQIVANGHGVWAIGLGLCPAMTSAFTGGTYAAPFIRGHFNQHHLGQPGSAPQIDGSVEWKPLAEVPNNNQGFALFSYLRSGEAAPALSTVGAATPITGGSGGGVVLGTVGGFGTASDTSGQLVVTLQTGASTWASGSNLIATLTTACGRSPTAIILSWIGSANAQFNYVAIGSQANFQLSATVTATGVFKIWLVNQTSATPASSANGSLTLSYVCLY